MTGDKKTDNRRITERSALDRYVEVRFQSEPMVGPGENISEQGVFFVSDGAVRVTVTIDGQDEEIPGELVRIQAMGEGRMGIAVRFN